MTLDNTIRTGPDHRTDFERAYPNIAGYLSDDEDKVVYQDMNSLQLDRLDAAIDAMEAACIAIHHIMAELPYHEGVTSRLYTMTGTIFENAEDLAFDSLFTDQDDDED